MYPTAPIAKDRFGRLFKQCYDRDKPAWRWNKDLAEHGYKNAQSCPGCTSLAKTPAYLHDSFVIAVSAKTLGPPMNETALAYKRFSPSPRKRTPARRAAVREMIEPGWFLVTEDFQPRPYRLP